MDEKQKKVEKWEEKLKRLILSFSIFVVMLISFLIEQDSGFFFRLLTGFNTFFWFGIFLCELMDDEQSTRFWVNLGYISLLLVIIYRVATYQI